MQTYFIDSSVFMSLLIKDGKSKEAWSKLSDIANSKRKSGVVSTTVLGEVLFVLRRDTKPEQIEGAVVEFNRLLNKAKVRVEIPAYKTYVKKLNSLGNVAHRNGSIDAALLAEAIALGADHFLTTDSGISPRDVGGSIKVEIVG